MEKRLINENWQMQIMGKNVYGISEDWLDIQVPGSVYSNLLRQKLMPDPYVRMNELEALQLMENDFRFRTVFPISKQQAESDFLILCFEGIDTLADIYLNGKHLGHTDNMHRIWEFHILETANIGKNELLVEFKSPTRYIEEEDKMLQTVGPAECMKGFPHLRKAHCMFGWDWGPRLPDVGIFREVSLLFGRKARLEQVYITQNWMKSVAEQKKDMSSTVVDVRFDVSIGDFCNGEKYEIRTALFDRNGELIAEKSSKGDENRERVETVYAWNTLTVQNPERWWPHGYGEQPLYCAEVILIDKDGEVLDVWRRRIGLRTMTVCTEKDEWGECFAHEVNGVKIFAMGADYVPEDNILTRVTKKRTEKLLRDAVAANHNCIRVWGGGYYPDDWFFDLCDELGLVVWQDFMFACASYELDDAFERNISEEIRDNVRRIRHHACLGLWCGNNELETQTLDKAWKPTPKQENDYIRIFEYIIPKILKEEDPTTFYWPSSPSSGGNFDNPWDENRGDAHYWDVWHNNKPFTEYRKYFFRYLSEFGFQAFPCLKTVESFTEPEDRNIFSRVMEMHQRNVAANGKILSYLSATYLYPGDFDTLLYASQLLQADAIRYGIEHFRRYRGRCMGTVVWQLNDIWPVASWAGIDYYGRWKALHYAEMRAFSPIMISCEEVGELSERPFCIAQPASIKKSVRLHVANETMHVVKGTAFWQLRHADGEIILEGKEDVTVKPLSGTWLLERDFSDFNELEVYFSYAFETEGQVVSENTCLFTAPKHFPFKDPKLSCVREGSSLMVSAQSYAKNVEIAGVDGDIRLSDNFFDMNPGVKRVEIIEGDASEFVLRSVYQIR